MSVGELGRTRCGARGILKIALQLVIKYLLESVELLSLKSPIHKLSLPLGGTSLFFTFSVSVSAPASP